MKQEKHLYDLKYLCIKKWKEGSLILIYVMTLGESFSLEEFLEKVIQLG